jgi:hypothetical protein
MPPAAMIRTGPFRKQLFSGGFFKVMAHGISLKKPQEKGNRPGAPAFPGSDETRAAAFI